VPFRAIPVVFLILLLSACAETIKKSETISAAPARSDTVTVMPRGGTAKMDEEAFWRIVDSARARASGDPYSMADVLKSDFAGSDDASLRAFQRQLIDVSARLYTWRHWDAAEMICGFASDDFFTDWRSWVIALGHETDARVAENPDNLAGVADLSGSCDGGGEFFGSAAAIIYYERHGDEDDDFPIIMPITSPSGEQLTDLHAIRRALPRLAARFGTDDGLGRPPRELD
jgi:hypothetical protein